MKRLLVSAAVLGLFYSAPAFAQAAPASATANANAEVVNTITLTKTADLNFGKIAADTAQGTVTVSTTGGRTSTSPSLLIAGTTPTAAAFTVGGQSGLGYNISLAADPITLKLATDNSKTMSADLTLSKTSGTLVAGTDTLTVGGALTVGATQAPGSYQGTLQVTVVYN
jgi:opacity protein-like surface antigen